MKAADSYPKIITDDTLKEKQPHGSAAYPFRYYLEDVWLFDLHCIDWHWHPEVEFVYLREGSARFLIGSSSYQLSAGQAIFINAQVIHCINAEDHAIIPNIVFSPALLASEASLVYTLAIEPVLSSSVECMIFSEDIPWQKEALQALTEVFSIQENDGDPLETVRTLFALWSNLYRHLPAPQSALGIHPPRKFRLQMLMQYIHSHYQQKVTLDDLALAAELSKSSVLKLFAQELHISPVNYLIRYRLQCAARRLRFTEDHVSEIAQDVGFDNLGYFCRKFKALWGMTPSEYRAHKKNEE